MGYDLKDARQAAIGGFSTVLFFFAIRQGEPLSVDPTVGAIIGGIWLILLFSANNDKKERTEHLKHTTANIAVVAILTGILTIAFKMGTIEQLLSTNYFGSAAWIAVWIAMPVAMLFDMNNFTNVLSRYYIRKRRK